MGRIMCGGGSKVRILGDQRTKKPRCQDPKNKYIKKYKRKAK
jgi:hypothetical protein